MPPKKQNNKDGDFSIKLQIENRIHDKLEAMLDRFEERISDYDVDTKNKITERIIQLRDERDKVKSYLIKIDDVLDDLYELFKLCNFYH